MTKDMGDSGKFGPAMKNAPNSLNKPKLVEDNYHTKAQKYITDAKSKGMTVKAEEGELVSYPKGSTAKPKSSLSDRLNKIIGFK